MNLAAKFTFISVCAVSFQTYRSSETHDNERLNKLASPMVGVGAKRSVQTSIRVLVLTKLGAVRNLVRTEGFWKACMPFDYDCRRCRIGIAEAVLG